LAAWYYKWFEEADPNFASRLDDYYLASNIYRELSLGDSVILTDMEGNRYTFEITSLRYEKHVDKGSLQKEQVPLVIFIKNIYSFEYLLVFCDVSM
jgi:hypothetical protein